MVDSQLLNIALAGIAISAGAAILIAAAIIGISAIVLHGRKQHGAAPRGARLSLTDAPAIESITERTAERAAA